MLAIYWPAYSVVGIRKFLKVQKAQEATIALEGYVPFVNTVARAGNAMERRAIRPGIRLPARLAPGVTAVSRIPRFPTESKLS
jgi:hypothetical protein